MPRGGGTAGGGKKSSNLQFKKPAEPAFLARFKEAAGYKEKVTSIDDKRMDEHKEPEIEDRDDRDDEAPVVVVLSDGDLSANEVKDELAKKQKAEEEEPPAPGTKIMFKKPTKRTSSDDDKDGGASDSTKSKKHKKEKKDKKSNKTLLSFNEDEEDG